MEILKFYNFFKSMYFLKFIIPLDSNLLGALRAKNSAQGIDEIEFLTYVATS